MRKMEWNNSLGHISITPYNLSVPWLYSVGQNQTEQGPCVLILVPKTLSPLLICLFILPCFHIQLHWTQTSELSSFVALTTRRPLIWWLSHWCIDGTEPVSLPASLSTSPQLSCYIDSQESTSGLIKAVFTCQLPLLVFQVWWLKVTVCIDKLGKKTFETPHFSHDCHMVHNGCISITFRYMRN